MILTINTGSSSVKLGCFLVTSDAELMPLGKTSLPVANLDIRQQILQFLTQLNQNPRDVTHVAHRLVHGGQLVTGPTPVTAHLIENLPRLDSLAPLHNVLATGWLRACLRLFDRSCQQLLVPDMGFFTSLPMIARSYALPATVSDRYQLVRYGFHGLAHEFMWQDWLARSQSQVKSRLISLQLGAGCSIAAILEGQPLDTSMGFTPLEGLVMATRCGDIDAGLILWLQQQAGMSPLEVSRLLNEESGLLGVSGFSSDMQVLLDSNMVSAREAVDLYVYRVQKYIGAYIAVLGGLDGIIFGGGVGAQSPRIRDLVLRDMSWAGIEIDSAQNQNLVGSGVISSALSSVEIRVSQVDEALMLVQAVVSGFLSTPD